MFAEFFSTKYSWGVLRDGVYEQKFVTSANWLNEIVYPRIAPTSCIAFFYFEYIVWLAT